MNIDIINFSQKEFNEIPTQDNPALTHLFLDNPKKSRCLMIVKANKRHQIGNPNGFSVLDIDNPNNKGDRVLSLGVFYHLEDAYTFAEAYIESIKNAV